jgi:hypothetical protein
MLRRGQEEVEAADGENFLIEPIKVSLENSLAHGGGCTTGLGRVHAKRSRALLPSTWGGYCRLGRKGLLSCGSNGGVGRRWRQESIVGRSCKRTAQGESPEHAGAAFLMRFRKRGDRLLLGETPSVCGRSTTGMSSNGGLRACVFFRERGYTKRALERESGCRFSGGLAQEVR